MQRNWIYEIHVWRARPNGQPGSVRRKAESHNSRDSHCPHMVAVDSGVCLHLVHCRIAEKDLLEVRIVEHVAGVARAIFRRLRAEGKVSRKWRRLDRLNSQAHSGGVAQGSRSGCELDVRSSRGCGGCTIHGHGLGVPTAMEIGLAGVVVTPAGSPLTATDTLPVNPFRGWAVIWKVELEPGAIFTLETETPSEKSGEAGGFPPPPLEPPEPQPVTRAATRQKMMHRPQGANLACASAEPILQPPSDRGFMWSRIPEDEGGRFRGLNELSTRPEVASGRRFPVEFAQGWPPTHTSLLKRTHHFL